MAATKKRPVTPSDQASRLSPSVTAVCAALAALGFWGRIDPAAYAGLPLDLFRYRAMAEAAPGLASGIPRPFAFRLLGPWLAGVLPFSIDTAFALLAGVLSVAVAVLFVRFLARRGVTRGALWLVLGAFVMNRYGYGFTAWNVYQVNDIIALGAILVMFDALEDGRWTVFACAFAVGLAARETPLVMLVVAVVYLGARRAGGAVWRRFAVAVLPGCALFALIRALVPAADGNSLAAAAMVYAPKFLMPGTWAAIIVAPFVPFTLAPVIFPARAGAFIRARPHMAAYVMLVTISAVFGHDNQRLMAPALPVVLLFVGGILDTPARSRTLTAFFAITIVAAALHHEAGIFLLPARDMTGLVTAGALAAGTAGFLGLRARTLRSR